MTGKWLKESDEDNMQIVGGIMANGKKMVVELACYSGGHYL